MRIRKIAQVRVRYGYRKIRVLLNREGWKLEKKLMYRLYKEEGLSLRHKMKRSVPRHRVVVSVGGQAHRTRSGVWISWRTSWQMGASSERSVPGKGCRDVRRRCDSTACLEWVDCRHAVVARQ